jgi:general secretion pathway protein I
MKQRGFTLLEVIIALSILSMALMAIYDLNAGAVSMHAYGKKLTIASLLARSKMTDLEQRLYDKGFSNDDEEDTGDFSDEGWSTFKWRAKIIAPRTDGVSPQQLLGAIFNFPFGGGDGQDPLAGLFGQLTGSGTPSSGTSAAPSGSMAPGLAGGLPMAMMQQQFTQLTDQLTKAVRELHLTVSWKEGKQVETLDLVTHVVSFGPGGDRNGNLAAAAATAQAAASTQGPMINARTRAPVPNPRQTPDGRWIDPLTGDLAIPAQPTAPAVGPGVFGGGMFGTQPGRKRTPP